MSFAIRKRVKKAYEPIFKILEKNLAPDICADLDDELNRILMEHKVRGNGFLRFEDVMADSPYDTQTFGDLSAAELVHQVLALKTIENVELEHKDLNVAIERTKWRLRSFLTLTGKSMLPHLSRNVLTFLEPEEANEAEDVEVEIEEPIQDSELEMAFDLG